MTSPVMKRAGTGLEMVSGTAALLATAPFVQATTPAKLTPFMVDYATTGAFGEPGSAVTVSGSASATPKKVFVNCVNDGGTQRLGGTTAVASVVVCTNSTIVAIELFCNSIFIALIVNRIIILTKHFDTSIQKLSEFINVKFLLLLPHFKIFQDKEVKKSVALLHRIYAKKGKNIHISWASRSFKFQIGTEEGGKNWRIKWKSSRRMWFEHMRVNPTD